MIHSYPWYIADWRNSETRLNLTLEERALYRELLDFCYVERSLPTDERKLARIANCSDEEFQRCWKQVKPLFNETNGRYTHSKVTEVLGKLDGYHEQKRLAGIASGERRRNGRSTGVDSPLPKKATENEPTHPIPSSTTTTEPEVVPTNSRIRASETDAPEDEPPQFDLVPVNGHKNGNGALAVYQREWFEMWWTGYWLKKSRKDAERAFVKSVKSTEIFEVVMKATSAQYPGMMAREPAHRPHGATWLNGERWRDEVTAPAAKTNATGKASNFSESVQRAMQRRIDAGMEPM